MMPTLQELLQKADSYRQKISSAWPLVKEELKSLDEYFRVGFTYSNNALSSSRRMNDMEPFSKLIAECVIEIKRDYCRLLKL